MMKSVLNSLLYQACVASQTDFPAAQAMDITAWETLLQQGLKLEHPRQKEHGDYAVNVSFLAKILRLAPPAIAEKIVKHIHTPHIGVQQIGGFINFQLSPTFLMSVLHPVILGKQVPGKTDRMHDQHYHLEFVSANPTGPLHLGHGRWAALGDSLKRIWEHNGARVTTEFYVNDYGQQMTNMANSVWFRALGLLNLAPWPEPVEGEKFPYYPGDYVIELAKTCLQDEALKETLIAIFEQHGAVRLETLPEHFETLNTLRVMSRDTMLKLQQGLLTTFRTSFDIWQLESALHQAQMVEKTLETLKERGVTYEQDGALWLKSSEMGDDKDRVLIKQDGSFTYLTADIAYHHDKFTRPEQYTKILNIWGADHHGYVPRIHSATQALGHDAFRLDIILGQLVNLVVDGEKTRMGKRKTMLTLQDVIDEVGVDATRFWLVARSADSTIEFDVDLAASASDENPVFYTQYAHARACGILRNAFQEQLNPETGELRPARFSREELTQYLQQLTPEGWQAQLLGPLEQSDPKAFQKIRETLLLLALFSEKVEDAGRIYAPHLLTRYALDLSTDFHSLYAHCRILCEDDTVCLARLALVHLVKITLAQTLELLAVHAPETM
jgi:arginyl-tRNA synthetase